MRKYLLVLCFVTGAFHTLFAQQFRGAVIGGFNLTQVDGDEVYGYSKFGIHAGAAAILPLGNHFSVSLETLFNQKGALQGDQYERTDSLGNLLTGAYKLRLNYLEVPVLIHYTDKDFFTVGTGFSWGRLTSVKEWEHGQRIETTTMQKGPYTKSDINVLADLRFPIYKKLKFNFRYAYSIAKIRTREFSDFYNNTWTRKQYNNLLTFRFIYVINEKLPPKAKE
jgi:hypothetical protein